MSSSVAFFVGASIFLSLLDAAVLILSFCLEQRQ